MLPALYIPIILMLIGLILRGVAFEFRFKSQRSRFLWDFAFSFGSVLAALMQGVIIGAFIEGFAVTGNKFSGGPFDWLTPFSAVGPPWHAFGLCAVVHGVADHEGRRGLARMGLRHRLYCAGCACRVHRHFQRLERPPSRDRRALVHSGQYGDAEPGAARDRGRRRGSVDRAHRRQRYTPFLLGAALFMLCYTGFAVSLFPYIVPPGITIGRRPPRRTANSSCSTARSRLLPIILGYTAYSYYALWDAPEHDAYH